MGYLSAISMAVVLLLATGGWAAAQEASPGPSVSPDPAVSPDPGTTPTPEQLAEADERLATATCLGKPATMVAIAGFETVGTPGADVIVGTAGDDIIRGEGGNDRICAGPGADVVEGGAGKDRIDGGAGNDQLDGGPSSDIITGGKGADMVLGAAGNDRLSGAAGDDTLDGGKGKDVCVGGPGIDWLPGCNDKKKTRGTVVVTKNTKLKGPHKGRFIIGKDGVTLNCDGHTVTGAGQDVDLLTGVLLLGRKNVTVRNCDLRDHFFGVKLEDSNRNAFIRNRATHVGDGFNLARSDANKLIENTVNDASYSGIALFEGSDKNRIIGNVVTNLDDIGFTLQSGSRQNRLVGNSSSGAGNSGFLMHFSGPRNELSGNTATGNTGFGIADNTTGFKGDAGTDNVYMDNTCSGNRGGDSSPATLCE